MCEWLTENSEDGNALGRESTGGRMCIGDSAFWHTPEISVGSANVQPRAGGSERSESVNR